MRTEILSVVTGRLADQMWALYLEAFAPVASLAAARHLLTRAELDAEFDNPRVDKIVGFTDDATPVGFITRTQDMAALPWISADTYRARFPVQAAEGRLYFLPIMAMSPRFQGRGYGVALVQRMFAEPAARRGIVAWDYSNANAELQDLVARLVAVAHSVRPARLRVVDVQTYYALDFDEADDDTVVLPDDPAVVVLDDDGQRSGSDLSVSTRDGGTADSGGPGRA